MANSMFQTLAAEVRFFHVDIITNCKTSLMCLRFSLHVCHRKDGKQLMPNKRLCTNSVACALTTQFLQLGSTQLTTTCSSASINTFALHHPQHETSSSGLAGLFLGRRALARRARWEVDAGNQDQHQRQCDLRTAKARQKHARASKSSSMVTMFIQAKGT